MSTHILKQCTCCGVVHTELPEDFKSWDELQPGGVIFNCECGTTLFVIATPSTISA